MDASELFETTISWLQQNYAQFQFFVERDVVWTLQNQLNHEVKRQKLPYRIVNDFPILPGSRRSYCTDLAILLDGQDKIAEVAVEVKYEPSHRRKDIWPTKISPSVVFWGNDGVGKDVERVKEFVALGKAKVAYSMFIDEGGFFKHRPPHPNTKWIHWDALDSSAHRVSLLWSRFPSI